MDIALIASSFTFFFNCFFYPFALFLIYFMITTHSFKLKLSLLCGVGCMVLVGVIVGVLSYETGEYVLKDGFNWWSLVFGASADSIFNY